MSAGSCDELAETLVGNKVAMSGHFADRRGHQAVAYTLVRAIPGVVLDVAAKRATEVSFAKQDHPAEALPLDAVHPSFGDRASIRGPDSRSHDQDADGVEGASELLSDRELLSATTNRCTRRKASAW